MNLEMKSIIFIMVLSSSLAHEIDTCPARPNSDEPVATGPEVIELLERCQDRSRTCGECSEKCGDKTYSHWIEKNCAKTCGFCVIQPEVPLQRNMLKSENVLCWQQHGGYDDKDIYHSVPFTSMNDCRDLCFADDECVGVHTTHFDRVPRNCELANGGDLAVSKRNAYYFGAKRQCLEDNPTPDCTDHMNQQSCRGYSGVCNSDCPTWKRLMPSVCRKTCKFCSEEDEENKENEEDGEDEEEEDEDENITWQKFEGKRIVTNKNNILKSDLSLEKAKAECVTFGEECAGLSCKRKKRNSKCEVLRNIDNQRGHNKYVVYIKS